MGTISMDMSSYEIEHGVSGYADEVLCTGWIPRLACHQPHSEETSLPVDLARVDAFLRKMYRCQR